MVHTSRRSGHGVYEPATDGRLTRRRRHRVADEIYDIGPGDVVYVPRNTAHSACCTSDEDLVIIWGLGGAPSLERAGYRPVPELLP